MDDFLKELAEALGEVAFEWCVQYFDAQERCIYHTHVHVPSLDGSSAAIASALQSAEDNVDLSSAVQVLATVSCSLDPAALEVVRELREKRHGSKPAAQQQEPQPGSKRHLH
jgi:hypothetical protein